MSLPILWAIILVSAAFSQIPSSEILSLADQKAFREEIDHLESLQRTAADRCTVMYTLAGTWAAGGQFREALDTLQKVIGLNVGLDPTADLGFKRLRQTREYQALIDKVRQDTPPVHHSRLAFTVPESDLVPEGIAYDATGDRFFLGSTLKHKIVQCTLQHGCRSFVAEGQDGLGVVLGLKADRNTKSLWAASNSDRESALFRYDLRSGKLVHKYAVATAGSHELNDLVVDSTGAVFVTDTRMGAVLWVRNGAGRLEVWEPRLRVERANGIALSADETKLYVAGFPDGITVVDLASRSFRPIRRPRNLCLAMIDGLASYGDSLVAIQNGIMTNRVVRLSLGSGLEEIDRFEVLERRNPLFNGISTGAIPHVSHSFRVSVKRCAGFGFPQALAGRPL